MSEQWCSRCGGPLANGVCENCSTIVERRRREEVWAAEGRAAVRRWVETFTTIAPDERPIAALFRALLDRPGAWLEVHLKRERRIVVFTGDLEERTIGIDGSITAALIVYLEGCMSVARRFHSTSKVIEVEIIRMEDGEPILSKEGFRVERSPAGFRVRPPLGFHE